MRSSLYQLRAFKLAFALARLLPRPALQFIASRIARRTSSGQSSLRENLRVLTQLDEPAVTELAARNVSHFSAMLADYFYCAARQPARAAALLADWRGLEHFDAARACGHGILLVTAHLGNWELGGTLLASRGLPMSIVTLEEPSAELTRWRDRLRQRFGIKTIAVGPGHDFAFVEMMQVLRRNEILAMLVDRPYAGTGLPVNFCGQAAEFSSAPALLWQHSGAAVVPAFVLQENGGQYISFADSPLPFARGNDTRAALASNTQILATHFEKIIRQHPEQWFNYAPVWEK